jgi:hypothetical protein
MKSGIFFTGTGPIIIVTSYDSFTNHSFIEKLKVKGLVQFLAFEVPVEKLKEKYGKHFDIVMNDLQQTDDLRVVDYNGHRILSNFKLKELGGPIYQELWE